MQSMGTGEFGLIGQEPEREVNWGQCM